MPTVRTSPDHGTAYDIAGHDKAEDGSMVNAIKLAMRMLTPSTTGINPA